MRTYLTICFFFFLLSNKAIDNKTFSSDKTTIDTTINRLERWLKYYNLKLDYFTDSLPIVERKTITFDYNYLSDTNSLFENFYIFSKDKNYFIDLDSYSLMLEKDSVGELISYGSEVDSETALIDIKGKKRIRILFCGTQCRAEEAYWMTKDLVYILGFTNSKDFDYPTIWTYEIKNNYWQEIRTKKSFDLKTKNYKFDKRLRMIKFKE